LAVIAGLGYEGVALTLDHGHLDPFEPGLAQRTAACAERLVRLGLDVVVETGARYVLDPWRKHEPTLLHDDGRERRLEFLRVAIEVAADLGAPVVSLWSGVRPGRVPTTLPGSGSSMAVPSCSTTPSGGGSYSDSNRNPACWSPTSTVSIG
jgi:sugar phosphate isomerase/epimerase